MKKYITLIIVLITFMSYGQVAIRKSCISTNGGTVVIGSKQAIFTVGETVVSEQTQVTTHLSEGFIGPLLISSVGIKDYTLIKDVKLYPNPTIDRVNISFTDTGNYEYHLFDMLGNELLVKYSSDLNESIRMGKLPAGLYVLVIVERNRQEAITLKIQKI